MKLDYLIDQMMEVLKERGHTEKTWKLAFRNGRFSSLRHFFESHGTDEFSVALANEYIAEMERAYENGEYSHSRSAHLIKLAYWFIELHETGTLKWGVRLQSRITVNKYYSDTLNRFLDEKRQVYTSGNISNIKSEVLSFLDFLQKEKKYQDFSKMGLRDIHDFILYARQKKSRINFASYSVKCFLRFLFDNNIIENDLTPALCLPVQKPKKLLSGFTHDEVDRILEQPDRSIPTGKRDYAILLLGKSTGLRIGDIISLKRADIDWINGTVSITQNKTASPLTLPLNPETEEAIIDYIRNSRPSCDLPFVFIRNNAPYAALSRQHVTKMFIRYREAAGVTHITGDGKSFHGLRRSIASWMLDADVPLTTISQVLGHRKMESTGRYLSIDEKKLQRCTFSLAGIEVTVEGLV